MSSLHISTLNVLSLGIAFVLTACAPPSGTATRAGPGPQGPTGPTRLTAVITGNPPMLNRDFASGHRQVQGLDEVGKLLNSPLTDTDERGVRQPMLAESVPSVENGLWRLFPEGRMETTWKIRPGVLWHDGTPFTAQDLLFTARVEQTPDLPFAISNRWAVVDSVEALDPGTVVVRWKGLWVDADSMFGNPYPRHLLGETLENDPTALPSLPYFSDEFIGTGPFRLREFVRDSHITMEANERYVLGRPKIDRVEVRFIPDPNTLAANILAGQADLTLGASVALELAVEIDEQWAEGSVKTRPIDNVVGIWPQLQNPSPGIIGDAAFRRALWHAIDRQLLVDAIQAGMAPIAHGKLAPHQREYADTEEALVRYPYDPRAAVGLIEALGYTRGPDGFFRDRAGETLAVELRTGGLQVAQKALFPVRDDWQRVGVKVDAVVVPPQLYNDGEYRATRPGFELSRHSASVSALQFYHSRNAPGPANAWKGSNKPRYSNPQMDAWLDQLLVTIPWTERIDLMRHILRHASDQAINLYLFYDVGPTLVGNRVSGVHAGKVTTNAHLWTVS